MSDDLADVPEPWRSIRLNFRKDLAMVMGGTSAPYTPVMSIDPLRAAGVRLRALRKSKGWSQRVLARNAGYAHDRVSDLERGQIKHPVPEMLCDICQALGCEVEDIWS
jgi:DNA-binding Xre family transcriptional regulator